MKLSATFEECCETDLESFSVADIEPPHKISLRDKEKDGRLPGIGEVSTRWVSSIGCQQLLDKMHLKKELQTLAVECKKALKALENGESSTHSQVVTAHQLCDMYIPETKLERHTFNQRFKRTVEN